MLENQYALKCHQPEHLNHLLTTLPNPSRCKKKNRVRKIQYRDCINHLASPTSKRRPPSIRPVRELPRGVLKTPIPGFIAEETKRSFRDRPGPSTHSIVRHYERFMCYLEKLSDLLMLSRQKKFEKLSTN